MTAPNLISLFRALLVPVVVWLIVTNKVQAACFVLLIAGLSDAVDGFLAKQFGATSELGAYLDPLADKLLLVSIFVTLGVLSHLPSWLVILVVSRDLMIIIAVVLSWMVGRPLSIKPLMISKATTAAQMLLTVLTLAEIGFGFGFDRVLTVLVPVTALLTGLSAIAYVKSWLRHMATGIGG